MEEVLHQAHLQKKSDFLPLFLFCLDGDSYTNSTSKAIINHIDPLSFIVLEVFQVCSRASKHSWALASASAMVDVEKCKIWMAHNLR